MNKGLQVLKTFVLLYERGDAIKDPLMEKAKDVLEKQLMSLHWEARDSAVKFIGTLTENQNGTDKILQMGNCNFRDLLVVLLFS